MKKVIIGVDVGGNSFKLLICDSSGALIYRAEHKVKNDILPLELIDHIKNVITVELEEKCSLSEFQIEAIGFGFPHPVGNGVILDQSNRPSSKWKGFKAKQAISKAFAVALSCCVVVNDYSAAIQAACDKLTQSERKRVLMLGIGTGIGGSVMFNGSTPDSPYGSSEPGRTSFWHSPWGLSLEDSAPEFRMLEESVGRKALEALFKVKKYELAALQHLKKADRLHKECIKAALRKPGSEYMSDRDLALSVLSQACSDLNYCSDASTLALWILQGQANVLGQALAFWSQMIRPTAIVLGGGPFEKTVTTKRFQNWFKAQIQSGFLRALDIQFKVPKKLFHIAAHGDMAGAIGAYRLACKTLNPT